MPWGHAGGEQMQIQSLLTTVLYEAVIKHHAPVALPPDKLPLLFE
jgi:hypothetical protein